MAKMMSVAAAKRAVQAKFRLAKEKLAMAERKAAGYVKKNPRKAVGIAAAVGAAIGAAVAYGLMRKRRR